MKRKKELSRDNNVKAWSMHATEIGKEYIKIGSVLTDKAIIIKYVNNCLGDIFVSNDINRDKLIVKSEESVLYELKLKEVYYDPEYGPPCSGQIYIKSLMPLLYRRRSDFPLEENNFQFIVIEEKL